MTDFSGTVVNQPSADAWQTLVCPGTVRLTFQVANAAIVYQLGTGFTSPVFDSKEQPLLPGFHSRERTVDAVRFKSLAAGVPAQVSIETATEGETG
ncbi:MAG: hypothetical protein ACJ75S_08665 [Solirubrobacterales bacterium]